jgi:hypothetical protein
MTRYSSTYPTVHSYATNEEVALWKGQHQDVAAWLDDERNRTSSFASSLRQYLNQRGYLTENQITAVRKMVQGGSNTVSKRPKLTVLTQPQTEGINRIRQAFDTARSKGMVRPKLHIGKYLFKRAPDTGSNPGAIYITDSVDGTYLGMIKEGVVFTSHDCDPDNKHRDLFQVVNNPREEAVAYGLRTGICSVCSRKLTNGDSINSGIGPVCAEKMGW